MKQCNILGTRVHGLSMEETMAYIRKAISTRRETRIVTANPEILYQAEKNLPLRQEINTADLVLPDGIGVLWASALLGERFPERVTGVDLSEGILREGDKRGWKVFLLGSKPGVAERAIIRQKNRYPGLALACHHGYFREDQEEKVLERIREFGPDVLLVGLGSPKQENWNHAHPGLAIVRMGIGGTIDVLAGEVKRAPRLFTGLNLEWFYRLLQDPARWRRQMVLPLYVLRLLRQKLLQK